MIGRIRSAREGPLVGKAAALAFSLLLAGPLPAAGTRIAVTATARDFLAGDARGTAITADGRLTLGVPLGAQAWPADAADAVVFAAASDASGRIFVATGGGLGRLFVSRPDGSVRLLFTSAEPNLTALAIAPDGAVICASSPNGRLYRVDPSANDPASAADWGSPQEAAIWALAFGRDGSLYVGTGNKGRIWRRSTGGRLELFSELEDVHVRSLAVGADGTVYAGTSDRGLVVAVSPGGKKRTLYDFGRPEVVGLTLDPAGTLYAAAATAEAAGPRITLTEARAGRPTPTPTPTPTPAGGEGEPPKGSVSVSTRTSRVAAPTPPGREGSGEIVAITPDGFVEPAWTFPEETVYSIRPDGEGDLVVTTGPRGRVYAWSRRHLRLAAQTSERIVVAAPPVGRSLAAVTMGAPGIFRPAPAPAAGGYTSAVKDAQRFSTFAHLRWEGTLPSGGSVSFAVRAGNSDKPDATWTDWAPVGPDGGAKLPAARFFQWRVEMKPGASGGAPVVERVELSYAERNARPVLENLTVLEPGAVIPRSGGTGGNVLSVTNPDENGVYAGLEPAREGATADGQGRRLWRKGFRTVTWRGIDPNGDPLRYDLEAKREGSETWFPIRRDLEDSFCSFDTTALPDGRYRFRVTASDRAGNPEGEALTATEETAVVLVDNTPPVLKVQSARIDRGDAEVRVLATDALSPVVKAEGTVNADQWRPLAAEEGAADAPTERFLFRVPKPAAGAILSVRVLDAAGNAAAIALEFPKDFR